MTRKTVNNIVAIDDFGRTIGPINGVKKDKYVGLFYFAWHGQFGTQRKVYDVTKIMRDHPDQLFTTDENSPIAPLYNNYYFNEPLYGYYNAADPYVIRKHIELFIASDVDFIAYDFTNSKIFWQPLYTMLELLDEYYQKGWSVPKVTFFTKRKCDILISDLYKNIYIKNLYPHLWFTGSGTKPYIIAVKEDVPEDIRDFFNIRYPQWPEEEFRPDGFPYVEKVRPQRLYTNLVNVSVAQHTGGAFSWSLEGPHGIKRISWGRGYTVKRPENGNIEAIARGDNFQEQWDHAISIDPEIVFVTGWNEWIAGKWYKPHLQDYGNIPYWVDSFNTEFSRDIEMTKSKGYVINEEGKHVEEGYGDNFYIQLIQNVRKYKGIWEGITHAEPKKIDINDVHSWDDVKNIYLNLSTRKVERDYTDFTCINNYRLPKPRNFVTEIRVSDDEESIYFFIKTDEDMVLKRHEKSNLVNLFLGFDIKDKNSFYSYKYVVNRYPGDSTTSIEKYENGFVKVGDAEYRVDGNIMQIKMPKALFGIKDEFDMHFKVADSVENEDDILDYYVSGDSVPMGRLSFLYSRIKQ